MASQFLNAVSTAKKYMFAVVRMLLHGSARPRKATTTRQPNCIFSENPRQGARELVANC
jgi:hypothetical protein